MEDSETTQIRSSRSRLPATALATTIPSTKVTIQISSVGHWQIPSTQFRSPATRRGPCDLRARAPSICWRGRLVRSWIRERSVGLCTRTRRKLRGVDLVAPHDVHYRNALSQQMSAMIRRWQRHHTASAHMMAQQLSRDSTRSSFNPVRKASVAA